jgi:uroporphyrinogen decarboxylase
MPTMTPRERVLAAINFRKPDRVPVSNHIPDNPLFFFGQAGLDLLREFPSDFGDPPTTLPVRDPKFVQPDGSWRREWTDEWGCTRLEENYGHEGIILRHPIETWDEYEKYTLPPPPPCDPNHPDVQRDRAHFAEKKKNYYITVCFFRVFERLHFLRGYENVLIDLAAGEERLAELADKIVERNIAEIRWAHAVGADAVTQSDDWGTQQNLMISPKLWREFFTPRYARTFAVAKELGLDVWFHSDGFIMEIIPDMRELGVKVLNPQFSCHDLNKLAKACRDNRLAVLADLDRQHLIPFGTPQQLRDYVKKVIDIFDAKNGGFIGHAECRGAVPIENVRAIFKAWKDFG